MVTKEDYGRREVEASKSVLVELVHILGEFKDSIVVVGGSVPPLLYHGNADNYVGTLDVDLALDHSSIDMDTHQTILKALVKRGYREDKKQPFIFYRDVPVEGGKSITVQVDLLSGEYGGMGKTHRTQKIQDIKARKARGSDLAFKSNKEVEIEAELPEGGISKVRVKISAIVPFLVMKGMALGRLKEKDSYDIYFCLTYHPGGLDALVAEFKPFMDNKLAVEGLHKIAEQFASPNHTGPVHIVNFEGITDEEEKNRVLRDAYERVNYLISNLGIV